MARILAIDYGTKRCGIAVTDEFQIIATPLATIAGAGLRNWLKQYFASEKVEMVIIGMPFNLDGTDTHATKPVKDFIRLFKKDHPLMPLHLVDEQFTSKLAHRALIDSGLSRKARQNKALVDQTAATIMLQEFLEQRSKA
ncbi:MAG: Holliday junction resolvase RuvX [Chitinophagaceae bacterium]|jgi:putative Holliday junction resolvase|nr:Holliday junction resolvase RuvX [Chitinophagaceae bacterium]